ncbi:Hypothetical protein PHPALM_18301 [Phytophthora palmivora]|uniref:Uncharacterized protein n=1 Tax=Phytophthora palmivora TaxID=4796 RepID=A0A2P4XK25_9STRA|nr:Hypothetical protein PHPALM_18301 [Phytophthora palmivora]
MNFEQNESQSSLRAVVNRVVKRRQHWLEEQRIDVPSKWVVEQGMKAVLEYLEKEEITSVTEEKLSEVWHKFGQQAAHEIAALIHQGADVKTPDGGAALRITATDGHVDVVSLLLEQGADVAAVNNGAALRITATDGHVDVVSLLLEQGADVAAVNNLGRTALHHAASNGHIKVVSLLVERGSDVAASDNDGLTVLHHAVTSGSTEVVKLLLDRGADAHALTKDGHNVLSHMVVAKDGNPDDSYIAIVRLLCLQERKLQLPPSTQNLPLKKYQLGLLACAEYWQDRHEKNQPLLEVPSEVVKGGEDAVKSYLTELEKTDASELIYRRKICVIGPSTWGKTSLIRSITKDTPVLVPRV